MLTAIARKWAWLAGLTLMAATLYLLASVYGEVRGETLRRWQTQQLTLAGKIGRGIEGFFHQLQGTLAQLARNEHIVSLDRRGKEMLAGFLAFEGPNVRAVTRIDSQGRIIYTWPFNSGAIGRDVSSQAHNARIMRTHQPVVSDVFQAVQGYQAVAYATPVFQQGVYVGCLSVLIPFKGIAASFLQDLELGQGEFSWVLSQKGNLLFASRNSPPVDSLWSGPEHESIAQFKARMMAGARGTQTFALGGFPDSPGLLAHHAVFCPVHLGDTFWSLAIVAPEMNILAVMRGFTVRWWSFVAVLAAIGLAAAYFGSKAWGILAETKKRQQAEEALRESEQRHKTLFESAHDAILLMLDQVIVDCNPRASELFGRPREDLLGRKPYALSPAIQVDGETSLQKGARVVDLALAGQPQHFYWRHTRLDGSIFDAEVSLNGLELAGQLHCLAIVRDVTERRQAERELAQSALRLREAQAMAHVGSWEIDLNEGLYWGSEEALRINGLPAASPRQPVGIIWHLIHPDDRPRNDLALAALIRNDQKYDIEFRILRADDQNLRHVHSVAAAQRDPSGRALQVVGTLQDITEQKTAREDKARLESQLRQSQKMEALGTLAGGIAHDFNNILSAVIGNTELALLKQEVGQPVDSHLQGVLKAGNRAKDLVRQILAFSRRSEQRIRPLKVDVIIKEALKLLRSSLPASLDIRQEIDCPEATVMADATQIHQVVMNLCVNAAAAMEPSGGRLTVSLSEVVLRAGDVAFGVDLAPGRYLRLAVSDTGQGIDPAIREKIFEPYFTTKKPGQGTGLGLAVVHGIIRDHGGAISVYSEPGQGSTFKVYLPQAPRDQPAPGAETDQEVPRGSERILVVDDELPLTEVTQGLLESLGYQVTSHTSSPEALERLRADPRAFDLVITDLNMPHMDGQELSREMLRLRPDLPVIIYTGFSRQVSEQTLAELGVRKLLIKPLVKSELARAVREALDPSPPPSA